MYTRRNALAILSLAIPPLIGVAYFVHRDLTSGPPENAPGFHTSGSATEGDGRLAELRQITKLYVASHPEAESAIKGGTELAPVDFLNDELDHRGEKWRVRAAHGEVAETYNIL